MVSPLWSAVCALVHSRVRTRPANHPKRGRAQCGPPSGLAGCAPSTKAIQQCRQERHGSQHDDEHTQSVPSHELRRSTHAVQRASNPESSCCLDRGGSGSLSSGPVVSWRARAGSALVLRKADSKRIRRPTHRHPSQRRKRQSGRGIGVDANGECRHRSGAGEAM
jgi:hypothetical protein